MRDHVSVLTSRDIGGVHFVFRPSGATASAERLAGDLTSRNASTYVVIFAHDQPDAQSINHEPERRARHQRHRSPKYTLSDTLADSHAIDDAARGPTRP
jgi:hypothetical protein